MNQKIYVATRIIRWGIGESKGPYDISYFLPNGKVIIFEFEGTWKSTPFVVFTPTEPHRLYFKRIDNLSPNKSKYGASQKLINLYGVEMAESIKFYLEDEEDFDTFFNTKYISIEEFTKLDTRCVEWLS